MATKKSVKAKCKDKKVATKAKVKAKCKSCCSAAIAIALLAFVGCASSEPASRLTSAEYGDLCLDVSNSSNVTINITLGDGAMSSSDMSDSTDNQTANPTNTTDVKPDVDVNTTGGKTAGVLESAISAGAALLNGSSSSSADSASSCSSCSTCSDN